MVSDNMLLLINYIYESMNYQFFYNLYTFQKVHTTTFEKCTILQIHLIHCS